MIVVRLKSTSRFDVCKRSNHLFSFVAVEGWVIVVTGLHPETQEDDITDLFGDCGPLKNVTLSLDRRTGYAKGYALIEFSSENDASTAIQTVHNTRHLGKSLAVDWAFVGSSRVDTFAGKGLRNR